MIAALGHAVGAGERISTKISPARTPWAFAIALTGSLFGAPFASAPALAQSDSSEGKLVSKADKSGTNPINFTNDLRAYYEYQDLSGGGRSGARHLRNPASLRQHANPPLFHWDYRRLARTAAPC